MQRILLTNNHLVQPGGSETWTLTVAAELVRRGHDVVVYAPEKGPFADAFPCPVLTEVRGRFDVGLVNHNTCIPAARRACGRVIMNCHGTFPPLEQPVPGADRYVAISEEVRAHVQSLGYDAALIRNPIDCGLFAPRRPIRDKLHTIFSLCQGDLANELLAAVCENRGWELRAVDNEHRGLGLEADMNEADVVVGLGRSAMEGLACGRAVLILDSRAYTPYAMDGLVTSDNAQALLECNLSGRRFAREATLESVSAELDSYRPELGSFGREFALANFEVGRQVDAYLDLAATIRRSPWRVMRGFLGR